MFLCRLSAPQPRFLVRIASHHLLFFSTGLQFQNKSHEKKYPGFFKNNSCSYCSWYLEMELEFEHLKDEIFFKWSMWDLAHITRGDYRPASLSFTAAETYENVRSIKQGKNFLSSIETAPDTVTRLLYLWILYMSCYQTCLVQHIWQNTFL